MPCVYLPGPAPAVTVANKYYNRIFVPDDLHPVATILQTSMNIMKIPLFSGQGMSKGSIKMVKFFISTYLYQVDI